MKESPHSISQPVPPAAHFNRDPLEKFAKWLRQSDRFLITTHSMPDGDGLGSEMALHLYLKKMGKKSYVINTHATPAKFRIVDPRDEIQVYDPASPLPKVDLVIVVDTNESKMLGVLESPVKELKVPRHFRRSSRAGDREYGRASDRRAIWLDR